MNAHTEASNLQRVVIPGKTFNLAGVDYILAPLNLRQLEELGALIDGVGATTNMRDVANIARQLALASLSRNYPDIDETKVKEIIDLGNMRGVIQSVLAVSGFKEAAPGES